MQPASQMRVADQPDAVGKDGCVPVPDGPGLGVEYDWDFIERNATDTLTFGASG